MKRRGLPQWVSEFQDRHGKWRYRARRKGSAPHYFTASPGTVEFENEYRAWRDSTAPQKPDSNRPGSISDIITRYYRTPGWAGLAPATKAAKRNILERFREQHGDKLIANLRRDHVTAMVVEKKPQAGRVFLKALRALTKLAIEVGIRSDDPTVGVRAVKSRSGGVHSWTEEEISKFEARHPGNTRPGLAHGLMLYTGQRRSDIVGMGWQHIREGRLHIVQRKTGKALAIAIHPRLKEILELHGRQHLTFLTTATGKSFTPAGFGNWFRDRCNEAGLPQCSAHGLRKAAARRLAEAGCSASEIAAVTGHDTLQEVERYVKAADQMRLADAALKKQVSTEQEQPLSNPDDRLAKSGCKYLKILVRISGVASPGGIEPPFPP
jgi:integrase